jgi:hypothetical protein
LLNFNALGNNAVQRNIQGWWYLCFHPSLPFPLTNLILIFKTPLSLQTHLSLLVCLYVCMFKLLYSLVLNLFYLSFFSRLVEKQKKIINIWYKYSKSFVVIYVSLIFREQTWKYVTQINKQYAKQCSLHLMSALYDNSRK